MAEISAIGNVLSFVDIGNTGWEEEKLQRFFLTTKGIEGHKG
jgi:hypothetical protein